MKFTVEPWSPEFGSPIEEMDLDGAVAPKVNVEVETHSADWRPMAPARPPTRPVRFVDGVRRVDARVWIESSRAAKNDAGEQPRMTPSLGLCASCAAGVVECDGEAHVIHASARRFLVAPYVEESLTTRHFDYKPKTVGSDVITVLMNGLAEALSDTEVEVAQKAGADTILIVDGPLRGRERIPNAIGYVKSHRAPYLPTELLPVLAQLGPGERTPVFFIETSWTRFSWYLRLAEGEGHPWAGMVRCEAPSTLSLPQVVEIADATAATLPGFASQPHKDPRAPQNLYPIKGLEDHLRRRLGDRDFLFRSIKSASRGRGLLAGERETL